MMRDQPKSAARTLGRSVYGAQNLDQKKREEDQSSLSSMSDPVYPEVEQYSVNI